MSSEDFTLAEPIAHRERQVAEEIVVPTIERLDSQAVPNAGLLTASMVLGIFGGGIGLFLALFGSAVVGAAGAVSGRETGAAFLQLFLIASPVASIVGAAIVRSKPPAGAILMGVSIVPLLLFFGFNFFTMLPVLLSGLGAALTFLAIGQAKSKSE